MQYRNLGASGLKVSEVALGGWLTHGRSIDDETTSQIVHRAFDLGVNLFDTADIYHKGEAERALGLAIRDLRRESLVLATKCFWPMSDDPNDKGLSRKHVFESVHGSLRRLGVDYVDLMQCHRYDPETPVEETVRAMDDLVRQGKILYWGVSMWRAHEIVDAVRTARSMNAAIPISNQPVYNMLNAGIESSVLPASEAEGVGQIVFSPLAQGVLTGKYLPGQPLPEGSRGADETSNAFMRDLLDDATLSRVQQLAGFVGALGCTLGQFALAWCLRRASVASVIVGATRVGQIEENAAASGLSFEPAVWAQAEQILSGEAAPLQLA